MHIVGRVLLIFGVLLAGIVLGGGAHLAASIVSQIGRVFFYSPLVTIGIFIGLGIGLWLGGDHALRRLGNYERRRRSEAINGESNDWNPFV